MTQARYVHVGQSRHIWDSLQESHDLLEGKFRVGLTIVYNRHMHLPFLRVFDEYTLRDKRHDLHTCMHGVYVSYWGHISIQGV